MSTQIGVQRGFKKMSYLERKISKKARAMPAKSMYGKIIVRLVLICILVFVVIKGCGLAVNASHNAPIPDWKLASFRYQKISRLPISSMTLEQVDSARAWWLDVNNSTREYRKETR